MPMVSRYFQTIPCGNDSSIIWHSIFGRPMLATTDLAESLSRYAKSRNRFDFENLFGTDYTKDQEIADTIKALADAHILLVKYHPFLNYAEQEKLDIQDTFAKHNLTRSQSKVKNLSLIMSEECPFRCKYCIHFANSNHRFNPEKMMSFKVAKTSIDYYINIVKSNHLGEAYINFGGGEPLLNWRVIAKLLPYVDMLRKETDIPIKMGINTNMALLTREIAETLIDYDVELAASLDGTMKGNNAVRLNKNLSGTYSQIIQGFDIMQNLGHPLDGFAMTVTHDNFFDLDVPIIDWAVSRKMKEVRIDIDVVGDVDLPINKIVDRLVAVRKYAKAKGVSVIGFWSRPAENLGLIPECEDVGFCGGERGDSLCVAPSGQVFPCGYSNYELGKYTEIPNIHKNAPYVNLLQRRNLLRPSRCQDCSILGFCRGGCMITQEVNAATGKIFRMCELYRAMTYEILRESAKV